MGMIAATIIGIVAFAIVASTGNGLGGLIFGAIMFAMSYGAFVWKPGNTSVSTQDEPDTSTPSKPSQPKGENNSNAGMPTHFQIGQILAMSLIEGSDPDKVDHLEQTSIEAAEIDTTVFVTERFLLRASVAAVSIRALIAEDQARERVTEGFYQWFTTNAQRSEQGAKVLSLLKKRLPEYAKAVHKQMSKPIGDSDSLDIDEVALAFGNSLSSHRPNDLGFGAGCTTVASLVAPIYWKSQLSGANQLFKRAALIT